MRKSGTSGPVSMASAGCRHLSLYTEDEEDTSPRGAPSVLEGECDLMFDFDSNCWCWFIGDAMVGVQDYRGKKVRLEVLD